MQQQLSFRSTQSMPQGTQSDSLVIARYTNYGMPHNYTIILCSNIEETKLFIDSQQRKISIRGHNKRHSKGNQHRSLVVSRVSHINESPLVSGSFLNNQNHSIERHKKHTGKKQR